MRLVAMAPAVRATTGEPRSARSAFSSVPHAPAVLVQVLDGTFSKPLPTATAIEAAGYDLDAVDLPAAAITPHSAAAEGAATAAGAA
jgi:hypothetical protein